MEVTPQDLCTLADLCLAESRGLNQGWSGRAVALQVDAGAAGNSAGGPVLVASHVACVDAGDVAVGRLAAVLEADMDDLYTTAFDLTAQDEEAARLNRATRDEVTGNPFLQRLLGLV
jgi:hypothetical protein